MSAVVGELLKVVRLGSLSSAPPQTLGAVRLIPLLRHHAPGDLKLFGDPASPFSLLPHGLVASFSEEGVPAAAYGAQLFEEGEKKAAPRAVPLSYSSGAARPRLIPLDLAMEGFLTFHFGGPEAVWSDYSSLTMS